MKKLSLYLYLLFPLSAIGQINLEVVGSWDYSIPFLDILEAGNNFSGAYESSPTQVNLSITKGALPIQNDFSWQIDVRRGNEDWHPDLQLLVKRTGDGLDVGLAGSTIQGGTGYQEITPMNQFLFQGEKGRTLIPLQYEIQNVSVTMPAKTYYTTIIYTVTEL